MAKRSTDLLEVFNRKAPGPSAPRRRGKKGGPKRQKAADFSGFFLGPRQLLLVCCVLLLLLVLSFVVGIGVGRRGDEPLTAAGTSLRRETSALPATEAWYVRGRLARVHQIRGERIDPVGIPGDLGLNPRHIRVEEAPRGYYDVFVGPFATEAAARQYWRNAKLETRGRKIGFPFAIPAFVHRARFR